MKITKIINVKLSNGEQKKLFFGQPQTPEEFHEMYRFRNDEYLKRGYIEKGFYPDGLDFDEFDREKKCIYFIAQIENRVIGTVRLIMDEFLPTEKECFKFSEPEIMKKIPRSQRVELGRLIVAKYSENVFLPRHVVMLGMLLDVYDYCRENRILGGYSFIKDKLRKKLEKIKLPVYIIRDFEQIYSGETLRNYFLDKSNPVWPIYYSFTRLRPYFFMLRVLFLKKEREGEYGLRWK